MLKKTIKILRLFFFISAICFLSYCTYENYNISQDPEIKLEKQLIQHLSNH